MKRYGPYRNNAGYWFWIDLRDDGTRRTVLVSRETLETKMGRPLASSEHAHHIDGDLDNNAPENLEAREGTAHRRSHGADRYRRGDPATVRALAAGWAIDKRDAIRKVNQRRRASARRRARRAELRAQRRPEDGQSDATGTVGLPPGK